MHSLRSWAARTFIGAGMVGLLGATSQVLAADYDGSPQVAEFIEEMTRDYGFAGEQLVSLFAEVERKQAILDAISRPAEKVKPWKEYRPIFITDKRIAQGVAFWKQNQAALEKAEAEYGVPAQFIVAIIGVETFYGGNTGNWRVMDALSTLAFDYPPRAPFFRKELRELGWTSQDALAEDVPVTAFRLEGAAGDEYWFGLPNFYTITRYNRSVMYAMAVNQLAELLVEARGN